MRRNKALGVLRPDDSARTPTRAASTRPDAERLLATARTWGQPGGVADGQQHRQSQAKNLIKGNPRCGEIASVRYRE
jgi:hypothetical protein